MTSRSFDPSLHCIVTLFSNKDKVITKSSPLDCDVIHGWLLTIQTIFSHSKSLTFQYPIAYGKIDYVEEDKLKRLKQVLGWMEDMVSIQPEFGKRSAVDLLTKENWSLSSRIGQSHRICGWNVPVDSGGPHIYVQLFLDGWNQSLPWTVRGFSVSQVMVIILVLIHRGHSNNTWQKRGSEKCQKSVTYNLNVPIFPY